VLDKKKIRKRNGEKGGHKRKREKKML